MQSAAEYLAMVEKIFDSLIEKVDTVVACFVCGSVAKGRVRPGKSDMIDGLVVFEDKVMESEKAFCEALLGMASACEMLTNCKCPTHPFQYYTQSELTSFYPASLLVIWSSDAYSRCIRGRDIRRIMATSPVSRKVTGFQCLSFFRSAQQLARLSGRQQYNATERSFLLSQLRRYHKMVPLLACAGLGEWVENSVADEVLQRLIPDLDCSILDKLDVLEAGLIEPTDQQLRRYLLEMLEFLYAIDQKIWCQVYNSIGISLSGAAEND